MSRGKKLIPQSSNIIVNMFHTIPPAQVAEIMNAKKSMLNRTKDHIRLQVNIPKELYAILKYWGAFDSPSESGFFCRLASEYVHGRIVSLHLNDSEHSTGTNGVH